jgi:hypothetical protein
MRCRGIWYRNVAWRHAEVKIEVFGTDARSRRMRSVVDAAQVDNPGFREDEHFTIWLCVG